MQKANWESRTPEQKLQALNEVDNINPDVLYGKAQALNQAIQNGEPLNVAMLDGIAKNLTKAGQEIEAAKHFIPTSPEGIVLETIKQTRKNTPKQVLKLKDETSQIVDEVAKTNAEIEKEFNAWLQKQNLPKQVKQYSKKGDRLALMKAMEKYRQGKIKGEFAKLEEKRLKAIKEFTEFGSGFKIAMRDLEIRGAGNIMGSAQHGHMATVGYDLYCRMLEDTVKLIKGEIENEPIETTIDLKVDAYIPSTFVFILLCASVNIL